ncbi:MAG: efflux RND transporter periplasmic adaptor subunit [Sandaracinaceae bacterium]
MSASRIAMSCALVIVTACDPPPDGEPEEASVEAPTASVRWTLVRRPSDASILEAPGVARAGADATGDVGTTFRARVAAVHVRAGMRVERGAPVVDVVAPDVLDAAAAYLAASRQAGTHRARADELSALRAEGLVDQSRVFEQTSATAGHQAELARAAAALRGAGVEPREAGAILRSGHITLRAPVAGVVAHLDARLGEIREGGAGPFARIVGTDGGVIEARTTRPWTSAAAASFTLADGREIELQPEPIASVVDPDDGTHVVWLAPREDIALADGALGTVRLSVSDAWEVPRSAVQPDNTVRRLREGEEPRAIPVEIVAAAGASAVVRGELADGDRVAEGELP